METIQIAQEYLCKQGYDTNIQYLQKWKTGDVFSIPNPKGVDFGMPQVVVVFPSGKIQILARSEVI